MSSFMLYRSALRRNAIPLSLVATTGVIAVARQRPLRLDIASDPAARRTLSSGPRKDGLNPEVVKQLSSGSVSGFLVGLVLSVFSKTLVLLAGVGIVAIQIASRWGIDIVSLLKLRKRLDSSRVLSSLKHKTVFKLSFGLTLFLSAFMSF